MVAKKRMTLGKLIIQKGSNTGAVVRMERSPFTIGRMETSSLILIDDKVSRYHAKIEKLEGETVISDTGSRNGVFLNGKKITRHKLSNGDTIDIGSTTLKFEDENQVSAQAIEFTEEQQGFASIQADIHPMLKLLRAQLPAKAIATQVIQYVRSRYLPESAYLIWDQDKNVSVRIQKKDQTPSFENFDRITLDESSLDTQLKEIAGTGRFLIAPLHFFGKNCGAIYVQQDPSSSPFSQKDKNDMEAIRLIAETALERSALTESNQNNQKKLALMEKFVSPEVLKDIFSKEAMPQQSAMDSEEKEVTILFCDIQGFTSLSERLPPSEISSLLNEYFERMVDVIAGHHGEINKFIGDAIMAMFGAPKSHGNDAMNSVAAALDMIDGLKLFWKDIDESKRFNIRIGINTGRVVVGNIGSTKKMEYTVLGDAVNIASRLEALAPSNGIMIGHRTAELIQGAFDLDYLPGTKVKGKSKEIDVYKVLGRRTV